MPDENADRLNELDNRAVAAVEQGDETGFRSSGRRCSAVCSDATRSTTRSWSSRT